MKRTLLDIVQHILSSLDSDEVNSIADTVESRQVAEIVRTAYFNIVPKLGFKEHQGLFSLSPSGDPDQPVIMYRPESVETIEWIKYNTALEDPILEPEYEYVTMLPLVQFLDMVHNMNPDEDDVGSLTFGDYVFYFRNNKMPTFCAELQDYSIIFDSYDQTVDTTLQETKTQCYGRVLPTFSVTDNFIPDLEAIHFPLLMNEAKSLAFIDLKQTAHAGAAQEARSQWVHEQKRFENPVPRPNYGRK